MQPSSRPHVSSSSEQQGSGGHASSNPKSLAELMKQRAESSKTSESTKERISSEPLVAWGDTGGPGRPIALGNVSVSSKDAAVKTNGLSLNHSTIAPPIRHIRRNTFSGSFKSGKYSSASASITGKLQSLIFPDVSYTPLQDDVKASKSPYIDVERISQSFSDQNTAATGSDIATAEDTKLLQAMSALREYHDQSTVSAVFRDIVQSNLGVSFDDVASLSTAKRLLNEAVILPLVMPEFFTGIREPWKVAF